MSVEQRGKREIMAGSAVRFVACAGVLAAGLLFGGVGVGTAFADTGDSTESAPEAASTDSKPEANSGGSEGGSESKSETDGPTSTVGNGREGSEPTKSGEPTKSEEEKKKSDPDSPRLPTPKSRHSLSIPFLRWPTPEEAQAGIPAFIATVEVRLPILDEFFAALQPTPEPTPGPAFRTQEEQPVADSTGGGDFTPVAAGNAEPPVLQAPIVVAPIPIPMRPVLEPVSSVGASAGGRPAEAVAGGSPASAGGPAEAGAVDAAAAGARAPLIRGWLPPTVEAPPKSFTPMSGQATRLGYPRAFRNPTVGELSVVALPGVGGLLFLTFSGGFIGYRQANSVRFIRTADAARFLR
jgi:hypothetical protein